MTDQPLRLVHYLNQFFGGIGGEEQADIGVSKRDGPVGPGIPLQRALGERATVIATVICGGEIDRGSLVDEEWLLKLEREHFVALAQMPKTQERIAHMLKTGKPLRN